MIHGKKSAAKQQNHAFLYTNFQERNNSCFDLLATIIQAETCKKKQMERQYIQKYPNQSIKVDHEKIGTNKNRIVIDFRVGKDSSIRRPTIQAQK